MGDLLNTIKHCVTYGQLYRVAYGELRKLHAKYAAGYLSLPSLRNDEHALHEAILRRDAEIENIYGRGGRPAGRPSERRSS